MATRFSEFVDKKTRQAKRELGIIKQILEKENMMVQSFLESGEPYIFLRSPGKGLSFEGVRIYKIGGAITFRIQKEAKTHPYGQAYRLDVEEMYNDLISEEKYDEEKAGKEVMRAVIGEMKSFFSQSAEAEKELRATEFDTDPMSRIMMSSTGTDYSSQVTNKAFSRP